MVVYFFSPINSFFFYSKLYTIFHICIMSYSLDFRKQIFKTMEK